MTEPPQQPSFPPTQPPPRSGFALASLLLGIGSFFTWIITGIPAIICGHIAIGKIHQSGGQLGGKGMAITGLVMGYVTIPLIFIIAVLAAMATPVILKQKQKADQVHTNNNAKEIFYHLVEYEGKHNQFPDSLKDLEKSDPSFKVTDFKPAKGSWNYFGKGKDLSLPSGHV